MVSEAQKIRIGTRGSPLALVQAKAVQARLKDACPEVETELVIIRTSGDWKPSDGDVRLSTVDGGKGQFAKEIEQALLDGDIDIAVHSMKDMDSTLPEGLVIDHMLEREDPRDALLLRNRVALHSGYNNEKLANNSQLIDDGFACLSEGMVVGTASVRRAAFLLSRRPDLHIVPFRGNVQTRIDKLRGENSKNDGPNVGCTLLAMAGLNRLGLSAEADIVLEPEAMLPAAGQGAVGIEVRANDEDSIFIISHISHLNTVQCVKAEREVLRILDGSCHTPIGAYATLEDGEMRLRVCVVSLDGQRGFDDEIRGKVATVDEAIALGKTIGERLKAGVPPEIFQQVAPDA